MAGIGIAVVQCTQDYVRERMGYKLDRQKELNDKRVHGKPFEQGDLVWLYYCPAAPRGQLKVASTVDRTISSDPKTV